MNNFIDLVICGPDMSGTSTQIEDTIEFFQMRDQIVKDMRGTEMNALFHTERFKEYNKKCCSLRKFIKNENFDYKTKQSLIYQISNIFCGFNGEEELQIASMIKNDVTTYFNPNSADVWIFEEPTKRGAGQFCRVIEQNRTKFDSETDHTSTALAHQAYRIDEFLRFRKPLRESGKIIIRSRSEESGCYQMFDEKLIQSGIVKSEYLNLPGHQLAFANPPTHLFIVHGPKDWTAKQYLELKEERSQGRGITDDFEKNAPYQVLVNERYATKWIKAFYQKGCRMHGTEIPKIHRFDIYASKAEIKEQMAEKLTEIVKNVA